MSETISIIQALEITGICMAIVFATLLAISFLIDILRLVLDRPYKEVDKVIKDLPSGQLAAVGKKAEELRGDDEIAAAMVAVIEASEGAKDLKVKVVAVREV